MLRGTPLTLSASEPIELTEPRRLWVGDRIGRGSYAVVYRAVIEGSSRVRRVFALKVFHSISTEDRDVVVPRIGRAVRRAAIVRHPNVAQSYEFGAVGGQPIALTELIEGHSLASLIDAYAAQGHRVPPDLALFVGIEVGEALDGARAAARGRVDSDRFVHGDLSAREILLSWHGEVKVTDFGIRAAAGAGSAVRPRSSVAARALTLAPEVAQGDRPDACTDVFSLGALLRSMLVGPRFAAGLSDSEILSQAMQGSFEPCMFGPRLPKDLQAILERAIEPDPDRRIPDARTLTYELRRCAMALGVGDGRLFLRHALENKFGLERSVDLDGPTAAERRSYPDDDSDPNAF